MSANDPIADMLREEVRLRTKALFKQQLRYLMPTSRLILTCESIGRRVVTLLGYLTPIATTRRIARRRGIKHFIFQPVITVNKKTGDKVVSMSGYDPNDDLMLVNVRFIKQSRSFLRV